MLDIYLYHHLGLGDHVICNGLVRNFAEKYDRVFVFCKEKYIKNIEFMYRDNDKIIPISVIDDWEIPNYINNNNIHEKVLKIGHELIHDYMVNKNTPFDKAFYELVDLDFQLRFDKFYIERDFDKEKELFDKLNPNNEPYIFVHDDVSRGFEIDLNKVKSDIKIIKNDNDNLIFEYLSIFENAKEIHVMESSINSLINSYKLNNVKLFKHSYVRDYNFLMTPSGLNEYEIIY
jgi:hypothetical protein